jgi:hypothetical protein
MTLNRLGRSGETGETAIPASLHDSLMARLDRAPEVKEIAQIAACIRPRIRLRPAGGDC